MYPSLNPSAGVDFDLGDQRGLYELYSTPYCPPQKDGGSGVDNIDWTNVEVYKPVDDFG
jgi:hypothetical protein